MPSLGNLGAVSPYCEKNFFMINNESHLECEKGTLDKLVFVGVFPSNQESKKDQEHCGDPTEHAFINDCTDALLDKEALDNKFSENC